MSQALTSRSLVTASTMGLTVLLWLLPQSPALRAQDAERVLLAADVPPQLTAIPGAELISNDRRSRLPEPADDENAWMATARPSREARRWRKFEAEFGIRQKSSSVVKGTLQAAKYNLDQTVFEMDNFVNNLEEALTFEYWLNSDAQSGDTARNASRSYFSPWYDIWNNTRLKSEVNLNVPTGRAFVGITLQFPFGN
jgi:hypothetical protein